MSWYRNLGPALAQQSQSLGRPFVIVATQRTGSTLLVRSLDASPLIFCAGELFHSGPHVLHAEWRFPQTICRSRLLANAVNALFERTRIENHLARYYATAGAGVRAIGFKVMVSQLRRYRTALPSLVKLGTERFYLLRQDSFATALSYFRAKASGIYHSDRASGVGPPKTITADVDEFRAMLAHCQKQQDEVRTLHAAHGGTLLTYEEIVNDWNTFVASVGAVLGIENLQLTAALDKLSPTTSTVQIENESKLRRQFAADHPH
jgi:LPS sulfotransferase NodH